VGKPEKKRLLKKRKLLSHDVFKTDFELTKWNKVDVA